MAAQFYKINYKSDFVLTINSDAGWAVPFCIKFWTGMPSHGYFAGFDGENYVNCRVGDEPTQLLVMFDDHHMPIGPLRMQIAYHTTIEEFPDRKFDEVTNPTNVTVDIDGTEYQVMLDFTGETDAEIDFSMPSSGVMSVNGKIGYVTLNAEDVGAQPAIEDLATIRSGAAAGATAVQPATLQEGLATKQNVIEDLATIRSGAAAGATAVQPATLQEGLATKQDVISDLATIRSGAAAGATAVQPAAMNTALAAKQDTLTFDNTPTANSSNPVKSSGIKTALDAKQSTISTVNVTVDNNTGTPSGSASVSGSTLSLSFQNLKGATGATGATGPQGPQGERGLPGESGVTGDVSGFTVIQTIDPSATYGATDIAGAATVQATNAELTELAGLADILQTIDAIIPSAASAQNQLADKNYVNDKIATNTANFVGTFNSLTELQAVQNPSNNDYGFVIEIDGQGNEYYDRYRYVTSSQQWLFEYKVDSTPFTAEQWAAIQSGITSALVTKLTEGAVYFGDTVGNVTTADFNAQTDTVWNKTQVLSAAQQAQARTNIGAGTVSSVTVNGTSYTPTNGDVNLGTIGGGGSGEANVIESISINGTAQTVTSKNVDLAVPTSSTITAIVTLTEAQYTALATKDSSTLYIITA